MMKATNQESQLSKGYPWSDLESQEGIDQLAFYRAMLVHLGNEASGRIQAIFRNANTSITQPKNQAKRVSTERSK